MDYDKINANKSKHAFVVRAGMNLANSFENIFKENLTRLMHMDCDPAFADNNNWDSEVAFYGDLEVVERHHNWCDKDKISYSKVELFETLLDLSWYAKAKDRFDTLLTNFEQCDCGFQKSLRTGLCARCSRLNAREVANG